MLLREYLAVGLWDAATKDTSQKPSNCWWTMLLPNYMPIA